MKYGIMLIASVAIFFGGCASKTTTNKTTKQVSKIKEKEVTKEAPVAKEDTAATKKTVLQAIIKKIESIKIPSLC